MKRANNVLELIGATPIVRLNRVVAADAAEVWGKLEAVNPGGSVKDRIALAMVEALLEYETIDRPQIDDIMAGRTPSPPSNWKDDPPSDAPTDSVSSDEAPDEGEDLGNAPSSA